MNNFFIINNGIKLNIITHSLNNPDAILIHLHGLHGHFQFIDNDVDNFYNRIKYLKKANILSFALEFRGHGKSDGKTGCVESIDNLISDIKRLLEYINCLHKNKPVYLLAESMGGAIAIKSSIILELFDGIVVLAPMFGFAKKIKPKDITLKILLKIAKYFPSLKINRKTKKCYNYKISYNTINIPEYLNKNQLDFKTFEECFNLCEWIKENKNKFDNPILIIHSNTDNITCINESINFHNECNSKDKELFLLNKGNHILLKPLDKEDVIPHVIMSKITNWINNRI